MENAFKDSTVGLCDNNFLPDHVECESNETFTKGILDSTTGIAPATGSSGSDGAAGFATHSRRRPLGGIGLRTKRL